MHNNRSHRFCVAPMMDWTDRHCRYMMRLISHRAVLYSEMVTAAAILHGDRDRLLGYDPTEHPLALQIGGSDPDELAEAARIAASYGYDEINLNVGCPSDRVQKGHFGACLMAEPERVGECIAAMAAAVPIPVSVKCRIGIDDRDSEAELHRFIETVAASGCRLFIVHARKAWLDGLSPKENRDVPPLDYDRVYRLKSIWPQFTIILNGGITSLDEAEAHLAHVDGVMVGRAAYADPLLLGDVDERLYNMVAADSPAISSGETTLALSPSETESRLAVVKRMLPYIERELARGTHLCAITRHMLGLVQGIPGARGFRRHLSENAMKPGAGVEIVSQALALVQSDKPE